MRPMIGLKEVREAAERLDGRAVVTPVVPVKYAERKGLLLKCENLQFGGAFKFRGAFNKTSTVLPQARRFGIVTCSSGNHAQGAALAARALGVKATVVMLDQAVPNKVRRTREFGARVIFGGSTSMELMERMHAIARRTGAAVVPPFDDPMIMAGQGTAGLEIVKQVPDVAMVVVPIGGGGLISGIATAIKALRPRVKVIGVEPAGAPKVRKSLDAGELVTLPPTKTIADGLKPVRAGVYTFEVIRKRVDDVVLVNDREILATCRHLILNEKVMAEPSGAASLAAVLHGKIRLPRGRVVCIVSGGNVELQSVLAG